MSICIAKLKGVQLVPIENLKRCLEYSDGFGFAYNNNGKNFIYREIDQLKEYQKIIQQNKLDSNNAMIYKFYEYSKRNEKQFQPLVISNDKDEILNGDQTDKSVIVFGEQIIGTDSINVETELQSYALFCNLAYSFDRKKNKKLFELSLCDNFAAILNCNGEIQLYGNGKKKWIKDAQIYYSNDDYKFYRSYNLDCCGLGYYDCDFDYNYDYNYSNVMKCEKCGKKVQTLILFNKKMMCRQCIDAEKVKLRIKSFVH